MVIDYLLFYVKFSLLPSIVHFMYYKDIPFSSNMYHEMSLQYEDSGAT